jgi:hypothetical protein
MLFPSSQKCEANAGLPAVCQVDPARPETPIAKWSRLRGNDSSASDADQMPLFRSRSPERICRLLKDPHLRIFVSAAARNARLINSSATLMPRSLFAMRASQTLVVGPCRSGNFHCGKSLTMDFASELSCEIWIFRSRWINRSLAAFRFLVTNQGRSKQKSGKKYVG